MNLVVSLIPLFPLLGFLIIALRVNKIGNNVTSIIASGSVLISFVLSLIIFSNQLNSRQAIEVFLFNWIDTAGFTATAGFLIDPLSSIMLLIITGVGFLIHVYSVGYMHDDKGFNRFFSYLNLFIFFMLLLVMGSNYLMMFIGWEGVGLCSYLLIGFWFQNQNYNDAANKAFIMNRIGDLGMLMGIVLIFGHFGSIEYKDVFSAVGEVEPGTLTLITFLLFIGAMGKSAQLPLYTWLPDAMAGPTPVSALIHAATMVTAGIYMVVRNNVLYSLTPFTQEIIIVVGLLTALFAATIAVAQNDIKKVLAYSTVSQLGLMFLALGLGSYTSGVFHMATHAFFKALLFLGAGSVIHALQGEQDLRKMGGLRKFLPVTFWTFLLGTLAISGIPPFAGFFSKDEILAAAFAHNPVVWGVALVVSLLTSFYMFRLIFLTFMGSVRAGNSVMAHIHEAPASMAIPLVVLAILSAVAGFMGVPEALHGGHWLKGYLSSVITTPEHVQHLSHKTEYFLMALITVLTLVTIGIAYVRYVNRKHVPASEEANINGFHRVLKHKYFIDELYHNVITSPLYWLSDKLEIFIEKMGIDKIVHLFGQSIIASSRGFRLIQNGSIGFYIFVMVIGAIAVLITALNI